MENKIYNQKTEKVSEKYSFDYRNLKFSGTSINPIVNLIVNWLFILALAALICWFIKDHVIPVLASVAGTRLISNIGKFIKSWKGGRSP